MTAAIDAAPRMVNRLLDARAADGRVRTAHQALIVLQVLGVRDQPLMLRLRMHQTWLLLVLGMLLCTLIGYFAIQPLMAGLRSLAGPDGVMAADIKARFGMLHGLASAIYLFQSLLAALLMFRTGLVIDTKEMH